MAPQLLRTESQFFPKEFLQAAANQKRLKPFIAVCLVCALSACQSGETAFNNNTSSTLSQEQAPLNQSSSLAQRTQNKNTSGDSSRANDVWAQSIRHIFQDARVLVEAETKTELNDIQLLLASDEAMTIEVESESQRLIEAQFGKTRFADAFLQKLMDAQVGTYAALFSSKLSAVMVSRSMLKRYERSLPSNKLIRTAALKALLIHELVHAADDRRYRIHENRALNFRASFAQSATFEGHAQWVTRKICAEHNCSSGLTALDNFMFNRSARPALHAQPIEAISHNVLEYSYVEGERFINALAQRPNGAMLIDRLLRSPPQDPIEILAPESFPNDVREQRNQALINASLNVDHPWVKSDWVGVEASPLKGVNLRSDPEQRQAAIDGFTQLIDSMVSMQLYDQAEVDAPPIEVTIMRISQDEAIVVNAELNSVQRSLKAHVYRSAVNEPMPYRTTIAVSGAYLVQVTGKSMTSTTPEDYALRVLLNLHNQNPSL